MKSTQTLLSRVPASERDGESFDSEHVRREGMRALHRSFRGLARWLSHLLRRTQMYAVVESTGEAFCGSKLPRVLVRLYTSKHCYWISAHAPDPKRPQSPMRVKLVREGGKTRRQRAGGNPGYLGLAVTNRAPHAGENWTRGNDLHDGDYSEKTWLAIIQDIVRNELVVVDDYWSHRRATHKRRRMRRRAKATR